MARILVADDHDALREGMTLALSRLGHDVVAVKGGAEAVAAYRKRPADVVVTDLRMIPVDGIEVVRRLRGEDPDATVLVVSAHGTIAAAVEAMRAGAIDFLEKPFSPEVLRARVEKAIEIARERRGATAARARADAFEEDLVREHDPHALVGSSEPMRRVLEQLRKVAPTDATVLVLGESGTGKELVARALHGGSGRRERPFVSVSCAAIPEGLLESELFGHEKGSFTGAVRRKLGRFELAHEGTLFLDEVGEIPPAIQVKLLRVLQERTYERVGESQTRHTDARIVAATNRDLRRAVAAGTFREDLYYRLRVFPIELPPLRERREDIEPVARLLLARVGARVGRALRFSPDALRTLLSYAWPGNVRELENALEFAATVSRGQTLQPEDLPPEVIAAAGPQPSREGADGDGGERSVIESALEAHRWSRGETARALGLSRSTLWRRMRALGLG